MSLSVQPYQADGLHDESKYRVLGYYECRLTNLVIGRMDAVLSKMYLPGGPLIKIDDLKRMNEGMMFEVKSQSDGCLSHTVDMWLWASMEHHASTSIKHLGNHTHNFHYIGKTSTDRRSQADNREGWISCGR